MEVPPKPVDDAGPLRDQVLAVREQQPDVPLGALKASRRQLRLTESSPRHSQGVDRVGLAEGPCSVSTVSHQFRRYPDDHLAGAKQISLEVPGEMPAILDRP